MFYMTPRISKRIVKHQNGREMVNLSATGDNIPLTNVNWTGRSCTISKCNETFHTIYEYPMRADDVCVVTFPKSGTTWMQEIAWLLTHNLDFKRAKSEYLTTRSPYLDFNALYTDKPEINLEFANCMESPRILKSHLPAQLIPKQIWEKKIKIIYCARNPKDMAVSYYHFHYGMGTWQGEIDEFIDDLMADDILFTPYWDHLMTFWQMRNEPNVLFVTYEEMKRDLPDVINRVSKFLNVPQLSPQSLERLLDHLKFDNMKSNPSVNLVHQLRSLDMSLVKEDLQFFRRGIVGSYKDELSLESQNKLNNWTDDNLKPYNLRLEDIFGKL